MLPHTCHLWVKVNHKHMFWGIPLSHVTLLCIYLILHMYIRMRSRDIQLRTCVLGFCSCYVVRTFLVEIETLCWRSNCCYCLRRVCTIFKILIRFTYCTTLVWFKVIPDEMNNILPTYFLNFTQIVVYFWICNIPAL